MPTSAIAMKPAQKGTHNKPYISFSSLRFQFVFGGKPEEHMSGKNITGNFTVTYIVPYTENFSLRALRAHIESEHDNNIKLAQRLTNLAKRNERIQISRLSIESIRAWFRLQKVGESDFSSAVTSACEQNYTTYIESIGLEQCTLAITPIRLGSLL